MMRKDAGLNPRIMTTEQLHDLFEDIDALGTVTSGVIDVDEFIAWLDTGSEEEDSKARIAGGW